MLRCQTVLSGRFRKEFLIAGHCYRGGKGFLKILVCVGELYNKGGVIGGGDTERVGRSLAVIDVLRVLNAEKT